MKKPAAQASAAIGRPWFHGHTGPRYWSWSGEQRELVNSEPEYAQPSPLERGVWLYPQNSTRLQPPATAAGYTSVYDGSTWKSVVDARAVPVWDSSGEPARILVVGSSPQDLGLTTVAPPAYPARWHDGQWVADYDRAAAAASARIAEGASVAAAAIDADYPTYERDTWRTQLAEAQALTADALALTPLLDILSTSNGIDRLQLAAKVIEKDSARTLAIANLMARRNMLTANVLTTVSEKNIEALMAITWESAA